jgi:hypothetical protein
MPTDRTSELIRSAGSSITIFSGRTKIETKAIPLSQGEFVVPREPDIPLDSWFRWNGQEYRISKIERSQLGNILICIEREPSSSTEEKS